LLKDHADPRCAQGKGPLAFNAAYSAFSVTLGTSLIDELLSSTSRCNRGKGVPPRHNDATLPSELSLFCHG
jgi:hypothetical protein